MKKQKRKFPPRIRVHHHSNFARLGEGLKLYLMLGPLRKRRRNVPDEELIAPRCSGTADNFGNTVTNHPLRYVPSPSDTSEDWPGTLGNTNMRFE